MGARQELDEPMSDVAVAARRTLRWVRIGLADHPSATPLLMRLTGQGAPRQVTSATDLLVEGYPRSGNTFAATAIRWCQPVGFSVSSHVHAASQVLVAARLGVPSLVVVRQPVAAAASLLIAAPYMSARQALIEWIRFHTRIRRVAGSYVVARFDEVTKDLGAVTARVNERFGTDFVKFEHTEANVAAIFDHIDAWNVHRHGELSEREAARPSAARASARQEVDEKLAVPGLRALREKADALYEITVATS